ncbi:MAG TPA: hypothetical protein VEI03_06860 [Stellaceae bacterium]|nr:hypothetical protein [Stellaceae bacterium]
MTEAIRPPIGGFLPLAIDELPAAPVTPWQLWTGGARGALTFHNARSALVWLLRQKDVRRLWLPAYICREVADAVAGAGTDIRFYAVGEALAPDAARLDAMLGRGDAVLGVDYFGFAPPAAFPALVRARGDVLWIEDRAQAFDPDAEPWGDWLIYSPRKLLGVPDGGLLVSQRCELSPPAYEDSRDLSFMAPTLERFEDAAETHSRDWYTSYREVEAGAVASLRPMSRLAGTLLRRIDAQSIASRRRRNHAMLAKAFPSLMLRFSGARPAAVPFGLALRVRDAGAVAGRLAEAGAFCARHWRSLPSDPRRFPEEHNLAQSLLTLPCDQRYGEAEMQRLIDCLAAILP